MNKIKDYQREYQKAYRSLNSEKMKEYQNEYKKSYRKTPKQLEYQREYQKAYRIKNSAKIKESSKQRYQIAKKKKKEQQDLLLMIKNPNLYNALLGLNMVLDHIRNKYDSNSENEG